MEIKHVKENYVFRNRKRGGTQPPSRGGHRKGIAQSQAGTHGTAAHSPRAGPGRRRPAPAPSPTPGPATAATRPAARTSGARCRGKVNFSTRPSWTSRPDPRPPRLPLRPLCNAAWAALRRRCGGCGGHAGRRMETTRAEKHTQTPPRRPHR